MKKNFHYLFSIILLAIVAACHQNSSNEDMAPVDKTLSVSQAKDWFYGQFAGGRNSSSVKSKLYWDFAVEHKFNPSAKSNIVAIPILHNSDAVPSAEVTYKQLWVYKNKNNATVSRVVEFIYDSSIPKKDLGKFSLRNFTGTMLVRDWDNHILGGFVYEDGKIKKGMINSESAAGGRKAGQICGDFETCYNGYNYVVGLPGVYYWQGNCYTNYQCIWDYQFEVDGPGPSDGSLPDNSGGSGGSTDWSNTYDHKFQVMNNVCSGYTEMLRAQAYEGKEMAGLVTTDGKIIILPSENGSFGEFKVTFDGLYRDILGRPLLFIASNNGAFEVTLYYYNSASAQPMPGGTPTYSISGIIHSHPIASGYDHTIPSPLDYTLAGTYSTLNHYIVNPDKVFKYSNNGSGKRIVSELTLEEACGSGFILLP